MKNKNQNTPAEEKKFKVIHKNGIKTDNRLCNLELVEVSKKHKKDGN